MEKCFDGLSQAEVDKQNVDTRGERCEEKPR